jgi:uncharacterized protein YigE (DUF2233 family)
MPCRPALALLVTLSVGCRHHSPSAPSVPTPDAGPPAAVVARSAEGLTVERDGELTLVRIDPAHYRLRVLMGHADGGSRTAPAWLDDFHLVAAINSSMYRTDGRSIGLLARPGAASNPSDNAKLGGFLFFDPIDPSAGTPPVTIVGRTCPGVDVSALRAKYESVVQDYRMLDCDGTPLPWKDEKQFSAAAIGLDADGRVVFIHSRAPHRMTEFDRLVAAPELRIVQALYVEGGPEASLVARVGDTRVKAVGSYETDFHDDSNTMFWPIPNVIGVEPIDHTQAGDLTSTADAGTTAP